MKTVICYYSYSGKTKARAEALAKETGADLCEVRDVRRPSTAKAYTAGCVAALQMKPWPIQPPEADLNAYDKIIVIGPVWASHPAPAMVALLEMLPEGKAVEVEMLSMSGGSKAKEKVEALLREKKATSIEYRDVKA